MVWDILITSATLKASCVYHISVQNVLKVSMILQNMHVLLAVQHVIQFHVKNPPQ